jgi:hypothetical protein
MWSSQAIPTRDHGISVAIGAQPESERLGWVPSGPWLSLMMAVTV